jgi:hypothetical protein
VSEPQFSDPNEFEPLSRMQVLALIGVTALVLLLIARLWLLIDPQSFLPITWSTQAVLLGAGLAGVITALSAVVYRLWPSYRHSADLYLNFVLSPLALPDLIWLGLLPGLSEEYLFRGVLLPAIGFNAVGVVLSSFLFGVLHMAGRQHWPYAVWATVVGLLLGFSALLTGNLLVPIAAHVITNLVSSVTWKLSQSES